MLARFIEFIKPLKNWPKRPKTPIPVSIVLTFVEKGGKSARVLSCDNYNATLFRCWKCGLISKHGDYFKLTEIGMECLKKMRESNA